MQKLSELEALAQRALVSGGPMEMIAERQISYLGATQPSVVLALIERIRGMQAALEEIEKTDEATDHGMGLMCSYGPGVGCPDEPQWSASSQRRMQLASEALQKWGEK